MIWFYMTIYSLIKYFEDILMPSIRQLLCIYLHLKTDCKAMNKEKGNVNQEYKICVTMIFLVLSVTYLIFQHVQTQMLVEIIFRCTEYMIINLMLGHFAMPPAGVILQNIHFYQKQSIIKVLNKSEAYNKFN